jgi:hypothetical protein
MNARRYLLGGIGLLCSVAWLQTMAATRLCSVYLESFTAFQQQLGVGMQTFQAPQLGAAPLMLMAALPGAGQMDNTKPLALHVLSLGPGETALVAEFSFSGTAETFLQSLGVDGALPPATSDGIYRLPNGTTVKIVGQRVSVVVKGGEDPADCLKSGAFPDIPDVPGVIRVSVAPAALKPVLDQFRESLKAQPLAAASATQTEQGRRTADAALAFYGALLEQVNAFTLGLDIRTEGVFLNTRLTPKPGSDIAALEASAQPASAAKLAFLDGDSTFSFATGQSTIPDRLKNQFIDFYIQMLLSTPDFKATDAAELRTFAESMSRSFGAAMAFSGTLVTNGPALLAQGAFEVSDPAAYQKDQLALLKSPAYQKIMAQSCMSMSEPTTRTYRGFTVYSWNSSFDEKAWSQRIKEMTVTNLPPGNTEALRQSQLASMRTMSSLFCKGYETAVMQKDLALGMGSPAMVEKSVDRIRTATAPSAEAVRIRNALALPAAPHALGRFSLLDLLQLSARTQPAATAALQVPAPTSGAGILFASWVVNGEAYSRLCVSADEIKAIVGMVQASQKKAPAKTAPNKNGHPAFPPVPAV